MGTSSSDHLRFTVLWFVCLSLTAACNGVDPVAPGSSDDDGAPTAADHDGTRSPTVRDVADVPADTQPVPPQAGSDTAPASPQAARNASPNTAGELADDSEQPDPGSLAHVVEAGAVKGPPQVVLTGPAHTGESPPRELPDPADDTSISAGPVRVLGSVEPQLREELDKVLGTRLRAAQACRRQATQGGEPVTGSLTLRFALVRGRPHDVTVASDTTHSETLGQCIARTLPAVFVRPPAPPPATRFEYPFVFHAESAQDE